MACSYTTTHILKCVESGDTFEGEGFILVVNGVNPPLTGATIVLTLNNGQTISTGNGITITDAIGGVFEIDKQIITFNPRVYTYEIVITFSDGSVKTYIEGTWTIL